MPYLIKKILFCLAIIFCSSQAILVQTAHAQEPDTPKVYVKVLFWAEDAMGNRDSCWLLGVPTATDTIDAHLGEVNLFGIEPQGDLDLRIIQRTDTNNWSQYDQPCWLYDSNTNYCALFSCEQNIDLKVDYRWGKDWDTIPNPVSEVGELFPVYDIALQINAMHYPVTVKIGTTDLLGTGGGGRRIFGSLYKKDGLMVDTLLSPIYYRYCTYSLDYEDDYQTDCSSIIINSAEENFLMFFHQIMYIVGIKEKALKIFILPNPAADYIILEGLEEQELKIFDVKGTFICSFLLTENPYKLDVSHFSNGTYLLVGKDNYLLGKFIKEGK